MMEAEDTQNDAARQEIALRHFIESRLLNKEYAVKMM